MPSSAQLIAFPGYWKKTNVSFDYWFWFGVARSACLGSQEPSSGGHDFLAPLHLSFGWKVDLCWPVKLLKYVSNYDLTLQW